jgi:subtilase family serine protease
MLLPAFLAAPLPLLNRRTFRAAPLLRAGLLLLLAAVAVSAFASRAGAADETASAAPQAIGYLTPSDSVTLSIVLPLRNQGELADLLARLYDPGDALYGKYLTPAEFARRFGPTQSDVAAIKSYAADHGFVVTNVSPNRTVITIAGAESAVESTFGARLISYRRADGSEFVAPDHAPSIPVDLSSRTIALLGLDTSLVGRSAAKGVPVQPSAADQTGQAAGFYGTGIGGWLSPNDVRDIYDLHSTANGAGQTVGIFAMDGWTPSDISTYETEYCGSAPVSATLVPVDGGSGAPTSGNSFETTLDIEMVFALAPGISNILVYQAPSNTDYLQRTIDIFNQMATDDRAGVVATSWYCSESDAIGDDITYNGSSAGFLAAENQIFEQMAAQGQTVCADSGDSGAYVDQTLSTPNVADPAAQPFAVGIGGTNMQDSATISYVSESSWADSADKGFGNIGTGAGGGVSAYWSIPQYQVGAFSTTVNPQGSTANRNVPDVSLFADFNSDGYYSMYYTSPTTEQAYWYGANGTSASCQLWAAFLADVNEQRKSDGYAPLGEANPAIYAIASNPAEYALDFHDIDDGSNNLYYDAVPGYDNSTGLGSFIGTNLLTDLANAGAGFPTVKSVSFSTNPVAQSASVTGTVTLSGPAIDGGAVVTVAQGSATVATVGIPAGAQTGVFAPTDASTGQFAYTASYNHTGASATLTVTPALSSLAFSPNPVTAGSATTGTITLTGPAPTGGSSVTVAESGVSTPIACTVPAGSTTGTFSVTVAQPGSVAFSAAYNGSIATADLTVSAASTISVKSLAFSPNPACQYNATKATVTLSAPAPSTGAVVKLKLSGALVTTIAVPSGQTAATTSLTPNTSGSFQYVATYKTSSATATLTVNPLAIVSLAFNPNPVAAKKTTTGTVTLNGAAPAAGAVVTIAKAGATLKTIAIASGKKAGTFTQTIAAAGSYAYAASYNGSSAAATLTVKATTVTVLSLAFNPNPVTQNVSSTGTVTLSGAAPVGGASVAIAQGATAITTVAIPAGSTAGTFTLADSVAGSFTYTASYNGSTASATLTVTVPITVASLAFDPTSIALGLSSTGTVTLSAAAPAGGASVAVTQGATAAATVSIPAGSTTGAFTVTPSSTGSLVYTAAYNGSSATATLTVTNSTLSVSSVSVAHMVDVVNDPIAVTVKLSGPAPAGGASVSMSILIGLTTTQLSPLTIPAGSSSASFTYTPETVGQFQMFTAAYNGTSASVFLNVILYPAGVESLSVNPTQVAVGNGFMMTVTFDQQTPQGGENLDFYIDGVFQVEWYVLSGSYTDTIGYTAKTVGQHTLTVKEPLEGSSASATVTVTATVGLSSFSFNPNPAFAGQAATGTVTLDGPAPTGGAVVTLSGEDSSITSVTVPAGQVSASFNVTYADSGMYDWTASYGGTSASAQLMVFED